MKLSSFGFDLPEKLIAKYPAPSREEARLMVVERATGKISHHKFSDFPNFFNADDVLVLNNTKVAPIYFQGYKEKTGASISILLLRELDKENHLWDTLIDPARKIRVGNKLYFGDHELFAEVLDNTTSRGRTVRFVFDGSSKELHELFNQLGEPPVEPILKRPCEPIDRERYQTVFAEETGSVITPVAGLHFTKYILKLLELKDVKMSPITLHISYSSLGIVDAEDLEKYKLGSDAFSIPEETAQAVNKALENKKKVCAVDISSLQAIESSTSSIERLKSKEGFTNKFIRPPSIPRIANALLTNFYLPKSIPFVNSVGFGGYDLMTKKVYPTAIAEGYRFFVYGDALLIL